ncbi:MAG: squalene--hopene cyclase [Actinomycetota bacterium]
MLTIDRETVSQNIRKSQEYLLSRQHKQGYWVGLLEADVSVVSGFIPLARFLGIEDRKRQEKAINYLLERQNPDGSWSLFYGGRGSIDVTIQTYFGLKVMGMGADSPPMARARKFILEGGGIESANTYTKIILALFGQYSWKGLPEIPPELIYFPSWFVVNIYDFASWTRATIMAFSVIISLKPTFRLKDSQTVFELYRDKQKIKKPDPFRASRRCSLGNLFLVLDRAFKVWNRLPRKAKLGREQAIRKVEEWIVGHQEEDGSWGGIMLPWLFSLIALKCLGYANSHPVMARGLAGLEDFIAENDREMILQPATSPVWDTAWTVIALRESGISASNPQLAEAAGWLLEKQVTIEGDWKVKNPRTPPGCWSFEFENRYYPDIDDTVIVSMALSLVDIPSRKEKEEAIRRGINWVLDMQNRDGSWAAFDRDNGKRILRGIPFADFITPLDFGSPDITAHVLWMLGSLGYRDNTGPVQKAIKYLLRSQKEDGSWYGRWGVNYIYGTSKVLQAAGALGQPGGLLQPCAGRAAQWLKDIQNSDGGWGESCLSFEEGSYRPLEKSTASQTAWALLGLMACCGLPEAVRRGAEHLGRTQNSDGTWSEQYYTGGGFPRAFYLKYEMYKDYFPLMALADYRRLIKNQ